MASWRAIPDFDHVIFDEAQAREFIRVEYEARHLEAWDLCNHPAMKSDLFRLAYLYRHGGVYIDADDTCERSNIEKLFGEDGLFRLRSASFRRTPTEPPASIYNNNPIFCVANDEILRKAFERATAIVLSLEKKGILQHGCNYRTAQPEHRRLRNRPRLHCQWRGFPVLSNHRLG